MTLADIITEFEQRVGFTFPEGFRNALSGSAPVEVPCPEFFADPIRLGPIPADAVRPDSRLEDFGYTFETVDNYHTYRKENCFCIDPLRTGDILFLIGENGRFLPALWFADHETTDVHLIVEDIDAAIKGATA